MKTLQYSSMNPHQMISSDSRPMKSLNLMSNVPMAKKINGSQTNLRHKSFNDGQPTIKSGSVNKIKLDKTANLIS